MEVLIHFVYRIYVKEILKFFFGFLEESEDAFLSSEVLQSSHRSELSLAHLQCYSDLQNTVDATNTVSKVRSLDYLVTVV